LALGITAISQSPISALGGTNAIVQVTGVGITTALGDETIKANANIFPTSVSLTTAAGQAQTDPDVIPTGLQLTSTVGDTIIGIGVPLTGVNLSTNLGALDPAPDAEVTG